MVFRKVLQAVVCGLLIASSNLAFASATLSPVSGNNNQTQINAALKTGGTVYLKAGTYVISDTIQLTSNTTLTGDRGAKIQLVANANWPTRRPMVLGSGVSNVRITGFEIDGNRDNNTSSNGVATKCGKYYYDIVQLTGSSNIEIDHMYLHHNWNDVVLSKTTSNLNFHDNIVRQPGHDIVSIYNAGTTYVTNNCMRLYCNSAARAAGGAGPMYVASNNIARDTGAGGYAAIEVQQSATKVYNCSNTIGNVATNYALLSGGTLHTGGCPNVPAMSAATKSCSVADLGAGGGGGGAANTDSGLTDNSDSSSGSVASSGSSSSGSTATAGSGSTSGSGGSSSGTTSGSSTGTTVLSPVSGNNNQSQINEAIAKSAVVYLKAGTYTISNTINLHSNLVLAGERGAVIKLVSNANWPKYRPMVNGTGVSNVRITGFEIDGNKANNLSSGGTALTPGADYYDMLFVRGANNVEIDNMYLHDNFANAVIAKTTTNLKVHDNVIRGAGVEAVTAYRSGTTTVTNNCMRVVHGGVRADSASPVSILYNDIASVSGATSFAAIVVENEAHSSMKVTYCGNKIHDIAKAIGYMTGGDSSMISAGTCAAVEPAKAATSCNPADLASITLASISTGGSSGGSSDTDTSGSDNENDSDTGDSGSGGSSGSFSVDGACGTTSGACTTGTATSTTTANGATTWRCAGKNGGSTASCSVSASPPPSGATTVLNPTSGNNNQVQINAALAKGGVVYLNAGTYMINAPITITTPNTTLAGPRGAKIKLIDNANWPTYRPLVSVKASGIRVTGFEIDGNAPNNKTSNGKGTNCGLEYYDIFIIDHQSNIEVDHMYLHDNWNDTFVVKGSKNVNVHDNVIRHPGHDVVGNYSDSSNVYVTNNCMRTYCNSGIRAYSSRPVYTINNDIARETGYSGGYAAFEIQAENPQLYNCNNNVHNMKYVTVFLYGASSSNYHVGGCPISPPVAKHVSTCDPNDIGATDISGTGSTTTATTVTTTTGSASSSSSGSTSSSSSGNNSTADTDTSGGSSDAATAPTITTSGTTTTLTAGSGSNQQVAIEAALKKGGTVYLKAGTYWINDTLNLSSNVTLAGDRGAKIKLIDSAGFARYKPMILGNKVSNVRIHGFEIDGNRANNCAPYSCATACGHSYYDMITLESSSNIEIDHMHLHHNWSDIVLSKRTTNLNFHNNIVRQPGHDIVSIYRAGTTYVTNNCMRLFCNSGARANGDAGPMYVVNNDIARDTGAGGYAGIEVQMSGSRVYDCNNNIHSVATKYGLLSGGTIRTGGCPISPAKALIVESCSVADIDKD
jgi:hypothetical protein